MISNTIVQKLSTCNIEESYEGYVNATALCKTLDKRWFDFHRLESSKDIISDVAIKLGVPKFKLVITTKGGNAEQRLNQGTWIHPDIVPHLIYWCARVKNRSVEKSIQARLAAELKGSNVEVTIPIGKIDVLTDKEIIEIKIADDWIRGVGQLITYSTYYPKLQKRLHLFGDSRSTHPKLIEEHCRLLDIVVSWDIEE